ncbi:MAG TPA: hypothetical protein H9841_04600 [Candidatus Flavonifractor merdigallinarum]|uniref:ATPase n=1 Tax=Candidatus Flavonifractor merdigallinarum TaxID=2838589 RepID=A0A9D2BYG7_9FIRM|nr:hypothetical protein [Candidatus Flavonifractor merdigallinarum]
MEFVDLINQIVAAEQNASQLVQEVQNREAGLDQDLERETADLRERYMARAKRRVGIVEETETAQAQEEIARLDQRLSESLEALNRAYESHREEWVNTLLARIVGGTP